MDFATILAIMNTGISLFKNISDTVSNLNQKSTASTATQSNQSNSTIGNTANTAGNGVNSNISNEKVAETADVKQIQNNQPQQNNNQQNNQAADKWSKGKDALSSIESFLGKAQPIASALSGNNNKQAQPISYNPQQYTKI